MERGVNWVLVVIGGIVAGLLVLGLIIGFFALSGHLAPTAPTPESRGRYDSNGETIYFTGFNDQGERIPFTGGPPWLYRHGGGCAACHGSDGRGGQPVMMLTEVPPDIRYEHLIEEEEHGEGEEHPPHTEELIKRAIVEGVDPAGDPLDPSMPRWIMGEADLGDLVEFLKSLD